MSRLVVVSNRVAFPRSAGGPQGGLAVGVLAALERSGGVWFGWDGKITAEENPGVTVQKINTVNYATMPLSRRDYNDFYKGFANQVLWPILHMRPMQMKYDRHQADAYASVNRLFAQRLTPLLRGGDTIWVHDFQCFHVGRALRELGCDQAIGFFLHVPFPPFDVLRALPDYQEILSSLCDYDLLGFQTDLDRNSFLDAVAQGIPDRKVLRTRIESPSRITQAGTFPIGIDVDAVANTCEKAASSAHGQRMLQSLDGRSLITGVERLDYTKGLVGRFRAFERLLDKCPDYRNRVTYMQIAQPSRADVPEYSEIRDQLEQVAGEINGAYSDFDWTPIRYLYKSFPRSTVLHFLAISRVGLVTPVRDGMNLVAKEFVAAQDANDPGVLVLSHMTGAAQELEGALLTNPHDVDAVADAIVCAVDMKKAERRDRWHAMVTVLRKNDVHSWRENFLQKLAFSYRVAA